MLQDVLLTDEEKAYRQEVREFVKNDVSPEFIKRMDRDEIRFPKEFLKAMGERNLLGPRFNKENGGRGLSWAAEMAAHEEVGVLGTALGCAFSMPSIVGQALHTFGTEEQKDKFLKPTLQGVLGSAEGLTEPRGGSDFFGATTKAELKNGYFTVRGQKRFVVGAEGADFFIVYCVTNPTGKPHERISLILIEKDREGVEAKYLYGLLGTRGGGTGRLLFKDVKVPEANLIGELNKGADIFNVMMIPERMTAAGGALGLARASLEVAVRYSSRRKAFGQPIRRFQGISFKVAEAITKLDAARSLCIAAGRAADQGLSSTRRLVSEAKKFATDASWEICNLSMQIVGGIGYTNVFPIEKMVRDARLTQIWTGSNEIMSLLIQHEYYNEVLKSKNIYRMIEDDAEEGHMNDEKVYEDEEMWEKGW